MLGLHGWTVQLEAHREEWHRIADETIWKLKSLLGNTAIDIQHIGSTSICWIRAKPIIDIVVGVQQLDDINPYVDLLEQNGIVSFKLNTEERLLFLMGDLDKNFKTHHIHVVPYGNVLWHNYINFRDYLNAFPEKAMAYDGLRQQLAVEFPEDRWRYSNGKHELIVRLLEEARQWRGQ